MSKHSVSHRKNVPSKAPHLPSWNPAIPPNMVELLDKVGQLLEEGQAAKALELIAHAKVQSPWIKNALGVCQLRLGKSKLAVDVFRSLVLSAGGLTFRDDVPTVFIVNFAVALLMDGNLEGCLSALAGIQERDHPSMLKLQAAIERWKSQLTLWQRLGWILGGAPRANIKLEFPPGDLQ